MNGESVISKREWAFFALRWVMPVTLGMSIYFGDPLPQPFAISLVGIAGLAALVNLVILALLVTENWLPFFPLPVIVLDALLVIVLMYFGDPGLFWLGALPALMMGLFSDWIESLLLGILMGIGMAVAQGISGPPLDLPSIVLGLLAIPVLGPTVAMMRRDDTEVIRMQEGLRLRGERANERAKQVARRATEYMRVIYEISEIMSASRLNPRRVLSAAIEVSIEGLLRLGMASPLFGAVLLFTATEDGTMLRIYQGSAGIPASHFKVFVPAESGALARTVTTAETIAIVDPGTDPELSQFEIFGRCKSALVLPLYFGMESYGVMVMGSLHGDAFKEVHTDLLRAVANQTSASLHNANMYVSLLEQRDRVVDVEKQARAQLAADLHDGPTQSVAAITMRLNYIRRLMEKKPEVAVSELYSIEDMARKATKEIRHMLFELRPKSLDDGIEAGLKQLAAKMEETYEQSVTIEVEPGIEELLDSQVTQTLFSIATEAVNNARKHAEAPVIRVYVGLDSGELVLLVSDEGKGFDVSAALETARSREGHLGLINLQERANLIGGQLEIDSAPDQGTRTTVRLPLSLLRLRREEHAYRQQASTDGLATTRPR